ncbi:XrtA/PEP-CTERM system TPR-repeat protein PrsT [Zoogloea sp.]|uniref:XrtA/PEP-CTERM system TPR-repeat protein PrsT n=1 Tax=Zoogloea sp. TaxID=49181 RepID=UPI001ACED359|nr:XrtA/PEP-CTERM system TPR-repeat protein PrsT [Zoogloea sp.]MBN8281586.1 PEP-CTERM system TPR-repeat protein PrsT [Zoogloea sp.]
MRSQTKQNRVRNTAVSALCVLLLAACGDSPESMLASAKAYMAKNDRNAASIQLKNALQKNPTFAEARFLLGKVNFDQGDYAGAEKELTRALDMGFSPDEVVPLLAQAMLAGGQGQRIITELGSKELSQSEAKASLMTSKGFALLQQGKRIPAQEEFNGAIKASAGFPLARVGLARMRALDRDLDGAMVDVDAVLKDSPKLPEAHSLRGDLLLAKNRTDEAITAYEAVIEGKPTEIAAYQSVISLLIRANKLEAAQAKVGALRKAVGNHPLAIYMQAFLDLKNGKNKEAYEGIQQVLRVAPEYVPALLLAASLQLQRNDFSQAQENLTKVLDKVPGHLYARRLLVSAYLGMREPGKALELLQPLTKDNSEDVAVLNLAGQVYAMNGDFTRSEEYFARAAKADPNNAQFRTRLGVSRLAGGETERAFQDLEAASALDAENIQADVTLIMAHLRRNETAKAMAAVQTLEKKKPNDPVTHNMKGGVLLVLKDSAGARKAFEKALELKSDFLPALSNLARLDIQDKQLDVARKRYEGFLSKNPSHAQAYLQYAEFMAMTGAQAKDVQTVLEKGLAASPTSLPVRLALVRLLVQSGDVKRALSLSQEAAATAPDEPAVLDLLGRSQVAAGETQQALATYNKLVARVPSSPIPLIAIADLMMSSKDTAGAEQNLRKALAIKPDSLEAQQRLVAVLLNDKRGDAAIAIAKDVQSQRKDLAIGYVLEAESLLAIDKRAEAVKLYEEAYKREKSAASIIRLHNAHLMANQSSEAAKLAADWIKANPKDLTVRTYLAERSLAEQKYDQAVHQYRQMQEIAPKNPMVLNNLAWALGKLNDKSAVGVAQQALALAPNSPVILDTLGVLQLENGEKAKGLENLRKAVSLGPRLPQLRLSLAKALAANGDKDGARKELDEALKNAPEKAPIRNEIDKLRASL